MASSNLSFRQIIRKVFSSTLVLLRTGNPVGTLHHGRKKVTTGSPQSLSDGTPVACIMVDLQANPDNTAYVSFGGADVKSATPNSSGAKLSAGASVRLEIADLNSIYVDAEIGDEGFIFTYYTA